jgi:hypothetical protein
MNSLTKPKRYRWLLIILGTVLIVFTSGILLSYYIENKINDKIRSLHGTTSFINVSLLNRSIKIGDLKWNSAFDSINFNQHFVNLGSVSASGINLLELLFHKNLIIDDLTIGSGKIYYDKSILWKNQEKSNSAYRSLLIKHLSFSNIDLLIKTNATHNFSAQFSCTLTDINLKIDSTHNLIYGAKTIEAEAKNIVINKYEGMYGGTIARLYCNTQEQRILIDSASLIPNFGKYEFAHQFGKQTDRITLSIPKLLIEGVQLKDILDSSFVASKMQIQSFNVVAFRDKRVPTLHEPIVPLPMESFLKFPYKVKIDSVVIANSMVAVEEIQEKGTKTSVITFENINATLTGFNNRIQEKNEGHALLHATGLLMGVGKIDAEFRLPLDGKSIYNAKGSISKMHFAKLNPALEPLANIRIESGHLNGLTFNFNYTDFTSKGVLEIDYQDLRLTVLGKNHHSTNEIRTLLLNAIVKNDRNKSLASSKRTGEIDIERDRKRFIFNVWWKSIQGGLKSIVLRTGKKNHTKIREERLARKEHQ